MNVRPLLIVALVALCYYHHTRPRSVPPKLPGGPSPAQWVEGSSTVGGPEYNGTTVKCDLPIPEQLKNKAGRNGSGLCVFTSIDMAARWANYPLLIGFRDYMTKYQGGGYPEKVVEYITKIAKERNWPVPVEGTDYGQFTDADENKLEQLLNTYRIVCVTYGYSPRYGGGEIAHMVCLVHFDKQYAAVMDNNFPGTIEWMPRAEFVRRWKLKQGGWGFWLGSPPPPPVPVN